MTEEKFEDFLKRTLDDLDDVPTPPREAMWAQIDQARRFQRRRSERTSSRRVWVNWGVGFAAMLAIGIGTHLEFSPQLAVHLNRDGQPITHRQGGIKGRPRLLGDARAVSYDRP